jgi:hypothetical protein
MIIGLKYLEKCSKNILSVAESVVLAYDCCFCYLLEMGAMQLGILKLRLNNDGYNYFDIFYHFQ